MGKGPSSHLAFDKVAAHPRFRFYGCVELGKDVTVEDLRSYYHQIFYANGAQTDRRMAGAAARQVQDREIDGNSGRLDQGIRRGPDDTSHQRHPELLDAEVAQRAQPLDARARPADEARQGELVPHRVPGARPRV